MSHICTLPQMYTYVIFNIYDIVFATQFKHYTNVRDICMCRNRGQINDETETNSSENRDRFDVETEKTSSQKPFAKRDHFDIGFESFSMNPSWLTFEIDNFENDFFLEC